MSMKSLIAAMPWRRRWSISWRACGLAGHRALHDQAHLGLGHLVVAVRVVLVELGMDQRLGLGALDEVVAVGVEGLELDLGAGAPLLEVGSARHVLGHRRLGDLEELVERELAVLVGVEFLERLHAVLQEVGARDLALLGGVDLHEPLRQGNWRRRTRRSRRLLRLAAWCGRGGRARSRRRGRLRRRGLRRGLRGRRPVCRPALRRRRLGCGRQAHGGGGKEDRAEEAFHRR